jgi:hypothetical protein
VSKKTNYIVDGEILSCTAKDCCCGEPVTIKTINGRRVPLHIR